MPLRIPRHLASLVANAASLAAEGTIGVLVEPNPTVYDVFYDVMCSLPFPVVRCSQLGAGDCAASSFAGVSVVVLAPHLLAGLPPFFDPETTTLYNFEPLTGGKLTPQVIEVYKRYKVWDYSLSGVSGLRSLGVSATLYPLTYSPYTLRPHPSPPSKDIHLLFYGTVTPLRRAAIDSLRSAGTRVYATTDATFGLYHAGLDELVFRAEAVLVLNTWGRGEWKVARLARLLANDAFIISEASGVDEELEGGKGVVFLEREELVSGVAEWLLRPAEEREARGREAGRAWRQSNAA